jgi:hypothetical protein
MHTEVKPIEVKFIEKGAKVLIYGVKFFYEEEDLPSEFDLVLGVDILKSDDDYKDYLGSQVVSEAELEDAVRNYMGSISPEVYEYSYSYLINMNGKPSEVILCKSYKISAI